MSQEADAVHVKVWQWWYRIQFESPPWALKQDPYLEGLDEETHNKLLNTSWEGAS